MDDGEGDRIDNAFEVDASVDDAWIDKDLVMEATVETGQAHHEIDLIDTSKSAPFNHGSDSMVGALGTTRNNDGDTGLLKNEDMDEVTAMDDDTQNELMVPKPEDKSIPISVDVTLKAAGPDTKSPGRVLKYQSKAYQQELRDEPRFFHHSEQNPSPGRTEENHSDVALSQDTGDGPESFYQTNPEPINGDPFYNPNDTTGSQDEQLAFMKELEGFFKLRGIDFKPPKFYGENLNCLKLWRSVVKLGGYDRVTGCKLWRQVGESFKPPKTCTTISWSFRGFYEKALLEYERMKYPSGSTMPSLSEGVAGGSAMNMNSNVPSGNWAGSEGHVQASGSGRARRDAAAKAMQGWHAHKMFSNGEVADPAAKEKSNNSLSKRERAIKNLKKKKNVPYDRAQKFTRPKAAGQQTDALVIDVGPIADWVKINVHKARDCFEVYALVPGLLREEVRVQCDPAGRIVISGNPDQPENPWGVTPFKKVISLPSRIDSHQTSAVVTLHGQLFVRVPFEQTD